MLRETSVCMFTVPISSGAATSVDSGTTDDTGIGSSCLLPSPSLPNGHSDPEFANDNPPPIPPKASRRIPPIPPRNGSHNVDNTDTCPLPIHRNHLPSSFNPSEDNIFSADLFYPMSCPCGRVEPSVSEVNRRSVFHPTQCEVKASNGQKFGCGSLQRIRTTLSRLFRSFSLREPFKKDTVAVSDTVRTPTLPPRSVSRNLEITTLRGLSSTQTLHAIYSTDQSPCVSSLRRRQPNQKFAPPPPVSSTSGAVVTGRNPPTSHCSGPPLAGSLRRQRIPLAAAVGKSSSVSHLRGRRQQLQVADFCDSSASTCASASRDTSFTRVGGAQPTAGQKSTTTTNNNNSVSTFNDLVQQASAVSASSPSRHSGGGGGASPRRLRCFLPSAADSPTPTSSTQLAQQPPSPVLLHHVHHIHHFHHFHHHHRESREVCPVPGLTPPPPLSEAGQSNSSGGSSPTVGCGDHLLRGNVGRCSAAALAPPVSTMHSRASNCACCCCASASCCACSSSSYPCSPDPLNSRGGPMANTTTTGLDNQLRHPQAAAAATADTLTRQTSIPFDSSNPNCCCCCQSRPQETSNLQPPVRCCSSASATLPSPRESPASGCVCCGCGGCCLGSRNGSPPLHQQHQQRQHHVHHHRHQHHSHQHLQQTHVHHHHHHRHSLHPPTVPCRHECRSRTAGSGVFCCCGASLPRASVGSVDSSWRLSTGLTPPRCPAAVTPCSSGVQLCAGLQTVSPRTVATALSRDSPRQSPAVGGHQPRALVMPPPPSAVVPTAPLSSASVFSPFVNSSALTTSTTCPSTLTVELQDRRSSFQRSMLELRKMGWYWGPLSFDQAQLLLAKRPDGTFLVRDSGHETYILSLSFRVRGETYHTRIEHSQGRFSFWSQPQSHSASTMVEFIEKAVAHSISGQFHYFLQSHAPGQPPVEVPLLYPLSRFQVVASLRHLVRFTILSHIRRDHIDQLPLPRGMLHYLSEKQCYVESLSAFEEALRDRPPLPFQPRQAAIVARPAPGGSRQNQTA